MPAYIPERNDVAWIDFKPTKGKEIGKYRPALILSSKAYSKQTGLIICCPISTSIRGGETEVPIALDQPCVVASSLIQTLSWRDRNVKFIKKATEGVFENVILRIIPLIGMDDIIEKYLDQ